jgi:hypothetical protein
MSQALYCYDQTNERTCRGAFSIQLQGLSIKQLDEHQGWALALGSAFAPFEKVRHGYT